MALKPIEQLFGLRGKSAVVTGGSKGIGKSIALRLPDAGASVTVTGRNLENLRQTVAEIESCGGMARAICADARSASAAEPVVEAALNSTGRLNILINNAGIYPSCPALDVSEKQWDEVKKDASARILLGEFGQPDDVANVVLFLSSGAANYVTGSVILVDGGYLLT